MEVFAAHGYRAGSFQDIADRVGMSQSSLFHHFPTKRDLLLAVLAERDALDHFHPDGVHAESFVDEITAQARRNAARPGIVELYTVLAGESVTEGHPARGFFEERFERLRDEYAEALEALEARGLLREGVRARTAAASLVALWDGIQLQGLLDRTIDVPAVLRAYLEGSVFRPAAAAPDRAAAAAPTPRHPAAAECLDGRMTDSASPAPADQPEIRIVSASREIAAPAAAIFELIADPARQPEWDGNDNLSEAAPGQRVHAAGDEFVMTNTGDRKRYNRITEFEEGRRVSWRTRPEQDAVEPGHEWKWALDPIDESTTLVTHTYDWTDLDDPTRLQRARDTREANLAASLERLAALAESR